MARPTKEGLEYFPMDVDIDQDDKLIVPIKKYGNRGFGVIVRMMMHIYRLGYFIEWTEREQYAFSDKVNEPVDYVIEIVDECLRWGFFHRPLYEAYGILTSKGFQKRYLLAASRRKNAEIRPEFLLLKKKASVQGDEAESNEARTATYSQIINYLNEKTGKKFNAKVKNTQEMINGRLNEGRTIEDFKYVIDVKCSHWLNDPDMNEYLRPDTLFRPSNFDKYMNQKPDLVRGRQQTPREQKRQEEIDILNEFYKEGEELETAGNRPYLGGDQNGLSEFRDHP